MKLYKSFFFMLFGGLLMFSPLQALVFAQTTIPRIYFCVAPRDGSTPYLIEFYDSIVFGVYIPEDADVSLYTNTPYFAVLYTINTNAKSGGYLPIENHGTINTVTRIAVANPCLNEQTQEIFAELPYRTMPLPVSIHHAIVVQEGTNTELANPFQRVVSFTFGIEQGEVERNLQVIQNSELDPFLNFRYFDLEQNTSMIVIANKDFGIGQSLPDTDPPEFSRERPSDIRSFVKSDLADLYGLDIFSVAEMSKARIFISSGLLDTYRGNYIRISLAPDNVERIPPLEPDVLVKALPDASASFIAIEQIEGNDLRLDIPFGDNARGQIFGESVYRVLEIEENTGQLFIDFNGNPAIVESWLIEAVRTESGEGD